MSGLGAAARVQLEAARRPAPFHSAEDVIRRVGLPQRAWLTLAESGAFDAFIPEGRRAAVWSVLHLAKTLVGSLDLGQPVEPKVNLPHQSEIEKTAADFRTTGLSTGIHPLVHARPMLQKRGVLTAHGLRSTRHGQWVKVGGLVISRQRPETAKGFMFISLEDETGFINVIVTPQLFKRYASTLNQVPFLMVEGPVSCEQNVWNVKARRFEAIPLPGYEHMPKGYNYH
jgi:error-prone DNA polymerase